MNRSYKILLVEDEAPLLQVLHQGLQVSNPGFHILVAQSGEEAVHMLLEEQVDLVITDYHLGTITGFEVACCAKMLHPTCSVILTTGFFDAAMENDASQYGIDRILQKPAELSEYRKAVREVLDIQRVGQWYPIFDRMNTGKLELSPCYVE